MSRLSALPLVRSLILAALLSAPLWAGESPDGNTWIVGSSAGIHELRPDGSVVVQWTGGEIRSFVASGGKRYALERTGVLAFDGNVWNSRSAGLPIKIIKRIEDGKKSFFREGQELKDLAVDPFDPETLVTGTKDAVFLSRDGGNTWKSLGFPTRTNGLKAVAVVTKPETLVFVSHPIYGVYYLQCDRKGAAWTELDGGLERLETTDNPDEVSDLSIERSGETAWRLWAGQTFRSRLYELDWERKTFVLRWKGNGDFGTVDSLIPGGGYVRFVGDDGISALPLAADGTAAASPRTVPDATAALRSATAALGRAPDALMRADSLVGNAYTELYLAETAGKHPPSRLAETRAKTGIYLPVNHAASKTALEPYLQLISNRGLNMVVVDMKDDYGRLRFQPSDPALAKKGRVFRPVDLGYFVKTMKERGVYLVARMVVFKDPQLAQWNGGRYAVWDAATDQPWRGYRTEKRRAEPASQGQAPGTAQGAAGATGGGSAGEETTRVYYDETWVDPYSEEVWSYVVDLCDDLIKQGFDEIQFDYIRFPTDGENLADARYRWKDPGMDMESALLSFLAYARGRIPAPLSIDIYGANGWYRTGSRTGQEVELLSRFVDAICPMYYPSHFEQTFLANPPAQLRPYRIYYRGTLRTERIARGKTVVRPYAQAFYLNVSYDKAYYGKDYVRLQADGVRDAGNGGLTYWNNVGRYDEVPYPTEAKAADAPSLKKSSTN